VADAGPLDEPGQQPEVHAEADGLHTDEASQLRRTGRAGPEGPAAIERVAVERAQRERQRRAEEVGDTEVEERREDGRAEQRVGDADGGEAQPLGDDVHRSPPYLAETR
jgi:hypothetical protein